MLHSLFQRLAAIIAKTMSSPINELFFSPLEGETEDVSFGLKRGKAFLLPM
jgi:hypothetical protein